MSKLSKKGKLILNLGCGTAKILGAINIDVEKSCQPDLILDFKGPLPFPADFVDKIYFFHVIEHIEAKFHESVLREFRRILKPAGEIYISYPEFVSCAQNYISNFRGQREFWKNTIFGRQLYASDFHVSLMDSREFQILLDKVGFGNIVITNESEEEKYNSLAYATKIGPKLTYEDCVNEEIFQKQTLGAE